MTTYYREMTIEHLGPDATITDLRRFQAAAELLAKSIGNDASAHEQATEYVWNDGDIYGQTYWFALFNGTVYGVGRTQEECAADAEQWADSTENLEYVDDGTLSEMAYVYNGRTDIR